MKLLKKIVRHIQSNKKKIIKRKKKHSRKVGASEKTFEMANDKTKLSDTFSQKKKKINNKEKISIKKSWSIGKNNNRNKNIPNGK